MLKNQVEHLIATESLLCRERNDRHFLRQQQCLTDLRDIALKLALLDLIQLVGDNHPRLTGKLVPQVAIAEGKIKVEGNVDKVMLLAELMK